MSSANPVYVGIDLGTTNSTAAVFDGDKVTLVRNSQGSPITPSVVRIDARGNLIVGARARRFLESDPDNTRAEFKRLMGTAKGIRFAAAGVEKRPEELAAEVLKSLRKDIEDQLGFVPARAVISVPALFELPQSSATSEAARLAGFERVELLQEPIASALAAGWTIEDSTGSWLVYDLGGGTFDVSLLETRDGLLRVVGHDGDNFLGGRDFDWAIVDWILERLARNEGFKLSRAEPAHATMIRKIKLAAEEAKIELSRVVETSIAVPGLSLDGATFDLDLALDRDTLERLCAPAIERSLAVCRRLLAAHGVADGGLTRVVMVGGPSVMPTVRRQVSAALGLPPEEGLDPMTLVAQGAAIYAATAGLEARPTALEPLRGAKIWLQYPAMSSDLTPHVVGRLVDRGRSGSAVPTEVRLTRADGLWDSPWTGLDEEGAFVLAVSLVARRPNVFRLEGRNASGGVVLDPPTLTIVQGLTISDPPLSRTIGVATAGDDVRVYFERGAPLPARRTFTLQTVETVAKGSKDSLIKIPIVQGEYDAAHLCRLVGALEISGGELRQTLPSGTEIELTIELDRGGRMSARALVPTTGQVFEQVAHLLVPEAAPEVLDAQIVALRGRLTEMRTDAFRRGLAGVIDKLGKAEAAIVDLALDVGAAKGGDADAAQKARRSLLELDALLESVELDRRWPELDKEAREAIVYATIVVSEHGLPHEQSLFNETARAVERARQTRDPLELQRQLRLLNRLSYAAGSRDPEVWKRRFEHVSVDLGNLTDPVKGQALIKEGREALAKGDNEGLRRVVQKLWQLSPGDPEQRRLGHDSGVR